MVRAVVVAAATASLALPASLAVMGVSTPPPTPAGGVPAAACSVALGAAVFLRSNELDPDVFVWDTRERAVSYAGGYWRSTGDVIDHSALSKPGTRAIVVACERGIVRSKYTRSDLDLFGVRIVSGPNRGRYGWVTGEDVHPHVEPDRRSAAGGPR